MHLLITWSTRLEYSTAGFRRELDVLRKWADSENGQNLYREWATDVQDSWSLVQLTVDTSTLMAYRRLCPDLQDDRDRPITGSYLAEPRCSVSWPST
jgi:hypothetical protein